MTLSASRTGAPASSGCITAALRTIGGVPTDECRSDAPAAHICRNRPSISRGLVRLPKLYDVGRVDDQRAFGGLEVSEHLRGAGIVAQPVVAGRAVHPDAAFDRATDRQ